MRTSFLTSRSGLKKSKIFHTASVEQTWALGHALVEQIPSHACVLLQGDLGAGKTQVCKGIIHSLTQTPIADIRSPTFTYLRSYELDEGPELHHFDLYRLADEEEFLSLGLDDLLFSPGVKLVEWPSRIPSLLPKEHWVIEVSPTSEEGRTIHLYQEAS